MCHFSLKNRNDDIIRAQVHVYIVAAPGITCDAVVAGEPEHAVSKQVTAGVSNRRVSFLGHIPS